jgi:Leucine-rich repeat (LRR) protein
MIKVKYINDEKNEESVSYNKMIQVIDIPYFNSIIYLDCSFCNLGILPILPTSLKHLRCFKNNLTELANLPNLISLYCGNNDLKYIGDLPISLKELGCSNNQLVKFKNKNLKLNEFYCYNNNLSELVVDSKIIYVNDNQLKNIDHLKDNVEILNVSNNKLKEINKLPENIVEFNCSYNSKLNFINILPNNLVIFRCSFCDLKYIPPLPKSIEILHIDNNKLTELPLLEHTNIKKLYCHNNFINQIIGLNFKIEVLHCHNNKISLYQTMPKSLKEVSSCNNPVVYNL